MTSIALMLMMQFMITTKGGYVNQAQGAVNVKAGQTLDSGTTVTTGDSGRVEVLLNPGSYLRLSGNSEAILEGLDFPNIGVRIVRGEAVIEAAGFEKSTPLAVTVGSFKSNVIEDGIYLISDEKLIVVDGKIQPRDSKTSYGKGWQLAGGAPLQATKIGKRGPSPVEIWSQGRSEELAKANYETGLSLRESPNVKVNDLFDVWLWSPSFKAFTFLPGYAFRSPYGHTYLAVRNIFVVGGVYIGPRQGTGGATADAAPAPAVVAAPPTAAPAPVPAAGAPPGRR